MNGKQLHTALLEDLFGPIRLHILRQDSELRMVHLYDKYQISRTLGIVRFRNSNNPIIKDAHDSIVAGELLGKTLLDRNISYLKATIFQREVKLPEWLRKDFKSHIATTMANYSQITIQETDGNGSFLYAELFEIIPPDIIHLIPKPLNTQKILDEDLIALLGFADITVVFNDTPL